MQDEIVDEDNGEIVTLNEQIQALVDAGVWKGVMFHLRLIKAEMLLKNKWVKQLLLFIFRLFFNAVRSKVVILNKQSNTWQKRNNKRTNKFISCVKAFYKIKSTKEQISIGEFAETQEVALSSQVTLSFYETSASCHQ